METKGIVTNNSGGSDEKVKLRKSSKILSSLRQSLSTSTLPEIEDDLPRKSSKAPEEHIYDNVMLPPKPKKAAPPIPSDAVKNETTSKSVVSRSSFNEPATKKNQDFRSLEISAPIESFNAYDSDETVMKQKNCKAPESGKTWESQMDADGMSYYTHPKTTDQWVAAESEDGRPYYYEKNSRMSLWELPSVEDSSEELMEGKPQRAMNLTDSPIINTIDLSEAREKFGARHQKLDLKNRHSMSDSFDSSKDDGRFAIHRISKEHITGPIDNKIKATERRGIVQRTKFSVDGIAVPKKWLSSLMIVTGPKIYFYKDIKSQKSSMQSTKPDMELYVKNVEILPANKSHTSRDNVFILVDSTNSDSVSKYLIQAPSADLLKSWETAVRYSKDWVTENKFDRTAFATHPPPSIDSKIINTLREFFRLRPTLEAMRASGILQNEPVFGSSIIDLCEQEHASVPSFVVRVIRAIEARGLNHVGLYRMSGNANVIQKLRNKVNQSTDYALNSDEWDIYVLTDSLKLFLRELKEPLFCCPVYDQLNEFQRTFNQFTETENILRCKKILANFPMYHYTTTKVIFGHLKKVAAESNNMNSENLSIVFGPNLLWPEDADASLITYANIGFRISEFFISCYDRLFV